MNSINLLGRLTKDPEIKTSGSGVTFCTFSLAVNRAGKKDEVDFFNCTAFNKTAELIKQYCKKGQQLAVTGSMMSSKKDDKIYWAVNVQTISFVGNSNSSGESNQEYNENKNTSKVTETKEKEKSSDEYDEDIFPF